MVNFLFYIKTNKKDLLYNKIWLEFQNIVFIYLKNSLWKNYY